MCLEHFGMSHNDEMTEGTARDLLRPHIPGSILDWQVRELWLTHGMPPEEWGEMNSAQAGELKFYVVPLPPPAPPWN